MATISMLEATGLIQNWLSSRGKADNTIKGYTTDIQMFFTEMAIAEITISDLDSMAATWMNRRRREMAPKTLGRRLTSMRTLGRCLGISILAEYSAPTPARGVPHPLPNLIKDLERMVSVARTDEQRTLLSLCGLCGLRITEAREVGPKDFDLSNMELTVRGKGDKTRIVPISKTAWSFMCETVTRATVTGQSTILTIADRHAREVITRLGVRAGIRRPVSSHDLRATFATVAYNHSGGNIRAVQELLGHSSVLQTQLYTGVAMKDMRDAASFEFDIDEL